MSKNITIAEGTQAKNFSNVSKVRINNIGGGTSDWIPEEDAGLYANLGEASITKNGTYNASDEDYDGFSKVIVKVDPKVTTKTITKNGTYKASKDKVDGFSEVSVQVPTGGDATLISKSITENGTYNAGDDDADGYSSVTVNVSGGGGGTLITKNITANGTYNASSDNADGYSSVTVNVEPTHGRSIVDGLNNAPVSGRISTLDFFTDLSEKAYEIGMSYYTSARAIARLENEIRTGQWYKSFVQKVLNYNNLVLVGVAGLCVINDTVRLTIYVHIDGIMDESGIVSLSGITSSEGMTITEYNGNKFTLRTGFIGGTWNLNDTGGTQGQSFDGVEYDINNNQVGADEVETVTGIQILDRFNDPSLPRTSILTNLTGGTIA